MARNSFNFGANKRPKKTKKAKKSGSGKKSNAWRAYTG
jgi:hypothetical protein